MAKHTYLANGQTKVFSQKLSCVRGNHIISGTSESWRGKTIRVRKLKPSILGCNILRVEYFLQVREGSPLIFILYPGRFLCCPKSKY